MTNGSASSTMHAETETWTWEKQTEPERMGEDTQLIFDIRKEAVSEIVGPAMMPLIEIEKKIPDLLAAIAEKKQAAEACITIV